MLEKNNLRAIGKMTRQQYVNGLTADQLIQANLDLLANFSSFFKAIDVAVTSIGSYQSMGGEIDISVIDLCCQNCNIPVAYPVWRREGEWLDQMHFAIDGQTVQPQLIMVPLVAINHLGYRLGMGSGYYDKYLAKHDSSIMVGVGWDHQYTDDQDWPVDTWDIPMKYYLSPNSIVYFDSV